MTGQQLIERWTAFLRQYLVLETTQDLVLALWAMHTWIYERFGATPYLSITATHSQAGKSNALKATALLSRNSRVYSTIRPLAVVRLIEQNDGAFTCCLDEAEKLRSASLGDTRSLLATGYQRGSTHPLTVGQKVVEFRTFCPKAFASIGDIQPILRARSIIIDMRRGTPARSFTLEYETAQAQADELIGEFVNFMKASKQTRIAVVDPVWLSQPRDREIWTPLFSLASFLGLHKDALDALTGWSVDNAHFKLLPPREHYSAQDETDAEERTMAELALRDIKASYRDGETFLPSAVIVDRMRAIVTAPWRSWRGHGLNEIVLAALLSRYGLTPTTARVSTRADGKKTREDSKTLRGYAVKDVAAVK